MLQGTVLYVLLLPVKLVKQINHKFHTDVQSVLILELFPLMECVLVKIIKHLMEYATDAWFSAVVCVKRERQEIARLVQTRKLLLTTKASANAQKAVKWALMEPANV
jgi:hypothetical protein